MQFEKVEVMTEGYPVIKNSDRTQAKLLAWLIFRGEDSPNVTLLS